MPNMDCIELWTAVLILCSFYRFIGVIDLRESITKRASLLACVMMVYFPGSVQTLIDL